jgi:hypothetical protein
MSKPKLPDLVDRVVSAIGIGILLFLIGHVMYIGYLDLSGKIDTDNLNRVGNVRPPFK